MPHLEQSQGKCLTHLLEQKLEPSRGSSRDPNLSLKRPWVRQDRTIFRRVALLDFLLTWALMLCRDMAGSSNTMLSAPLLLETPWAWLNVTMSPSKNTGLLKKKQQQNKKTNFTPPSPSHRQPLWNEIFTAAPVVFGQQATDLLWGSRASCEAAKAVIYIFQLG